MGLPVYSQKNKDEAAQPFVEARSQRDGCRSLSWLCRVKMEAGKNDEAKAAYLKSLEANPGDKVAINFSKD